MFYSQATEIKMGVVGILYPYISSAREYNDRLEACMRVCPPLFILSYIKLHFLRTSIRHVYPFADTYIHIVSYSSLKSMLSWTFLFSIEYY